MQKSTRDASCMLPARLRCLHRNTSECVPAGICSWSTADLHCARQLRLSGWESERQCGGSSARCLRVYVLSLAQALVDWFSSAEYGELQLVQEAYKGTAN